MQLRDTEAYIEQTREHAKRLVANCRNIQRSIETHMSSSASSSSTPRYYHVVAVPGQNGDGMQPSYVKQRFELAMINAVNATDYELQPQLYSIVRSGIPTKTAQIDFGQKNCKALLTEAVQSCNTSYPIVLYGNSQGTSTIIQWLADQEVDEKLRSRVMLVVLEAVMASGNSAIWHTVHNGFFPGLMRNVAQWLGLDAATCVLVSRFLFTQYDANAKQPIELVGMFPRDVPVIMTHARQDACLSYNDACAMMFMLRFKMQHRHAYLCTRMDNLHIDLYTSFMDNLPTPSPHMARVVQCVFDNKLDRLDGMFGVNGDSPMLNIQWMVQ